MIPLSRKWSWRWKLPGLNLKPSRNALSERRRRTGRRRKRGSKRRKHGSEIRRRTGRRRKRGSERRKCGSERGCAATWDVLGRSMLEESAKGIARGAATSDAKKMSTLEESARKVMTTGPTPSGGIQDCLVLPTLENDADVVSLS